MQNVLIDFTYYQGRTLFHGGGEYGNVILDELLKQTEQINCGIFFLKGKQVDREILNRCMQKGWNIHGECDVRNISSIVKRYQYTTLYSALPYINKWSGVKLPSNVRFIGTFHGLRFLELADCEDEEVNFFNNSEGSVQSAYIFGMKDTERRYKNGQVYHNALFAFDNCKIIAVSEHTKHSIYYYYPELQNADIEVLYSPSKLLHLDESYDEATLKNMHIVSENYGLIVSAGIWYKNGLRAVLAYDRVFERNLKFIPTDFKVVVVGVKKKEFMWQRIVHKERFVFTDYVSTELLESLYRNAQLFVYPSLNEGFGYPPLEAMKYGTLCACSVNTSISEVCKDMVLYFNPLSIDEIAIRILESFSEEIRKEKKKIIERQIPLIWERQKRDLKRIIDIIVGER